MSNIKKRVLVIVSGLALALIMGAVSNGPEYGAESAGLDDATMQIAGHNDGHGGGG